MLISILYCFRRMLGELTLREQEYLEFIRQKNVPLYNDVINQLRKESRERLLLIQAVTVEISASK